MNRVVACSSARPFMEGFGNIRPALRSSPRISVLMGPTLFCKNAGISGCCYRHQHSGRPCEIEIDAFVEGLIEFPDTNLIPNLLDGGFESMAYLCGKNDRISEGNHPALYRSPLKTALRGRIREAVLKEH